MVIGWHHRSESSSSTEHLKHTLYRSLGQTGEDQGPQWFQGTLSRWQSWPCWPKFQRRLTKLQGKYSRVWDHLIWSAEQEAYLYIPFVDQGDLSKYKNYQPNKLHIFLFLQFWKKKTKLRFGLNLSQIFKNIITFWYLKYSHFKV